PPAARGAVIKARSRSMSSPRSGDGSKRSNSAPVPAMRLAARWTSFCRPRCAGPIPHARMRPWTSDCRRFFARAGGRGTCSGNCARTFQAVRSYGQEAELFEVARELTHALAAQLALKSKSERGYELLEGSEIAPVKAAPIDLSAGTSTRDAFKAIGLACLKQVLDNEPALLARDPEGVHQMRVGLRRLRAAMSLFADILQDPQTAALKQELKWLTSELGPARELEVLVTRVVAPVKRRHSRLQGISSLSRDLTQQRA